MESLLARPHKVSNKVRICHVGLQVEKMTEHLHAELRIPVPVCMISAANILGTQRVLLCCNPKHQKYYDGLFDLFHVIT